MQASRRAFLVAVTSSITAAACSRARAQAWPQSSLRIVVGFQAGGTGDVISRLVGDRLGPLLHSSIVIENKAGASGVSAAHMVRLADDDHTLLSVSETYVVTPLINPNAGFNLLRDFKLIGIAAEGAQVILTRADAPFRTFHEFAKAARATSSGIDYATSGFGHPQHLIGEYIAAKLPAKLVHVPTRGGATAVGDLLAGTVKVAILGLGPTFQLIRDGKLVPLAVSSSKRTLALPQVPTLQELGFHGFNAPQWLGFAAPRTLSDDRVRRLTDMLAQAVSDPAMPQRLEALGFQPLFLDATAMASRISEEEQRWRDIVTTAKLSVGKEG